MLGVARIAGIMAAKKTSELVPLCHPVAITLVGVELEIRGAGAAGGVDEVGSEGRERTSIPWQGTGQGDAYKWHTSSSTSKPIDGSISAVAASSSESKGLNFGSVEITATVSCDGKTGVEMEALTAASVAALTVYDMCKAVDKGMRVEGLRVIRKEGGKSGLWVEGMKEEEG